MKVRLLRRRALWWPTWQGWLLLVLLAGMVTTVVFRNAESFLSLTERVSADVLVVEGWIGEEGLRGAIDEFQRGGYRWVISVGGWPGHSPKTTAELAAEDLIRLGCPTNHLLVGLPSKRPEDRTYECAKSACDLLARRRIHPTGIMVFTKGAHARRSRLVYRKAVGNGIAVGVIAYPGSEEQRKPWWRSTVRSKAVIEESCGWLMERLGFEYRD